MATNLAISDTLLNDALRIGGLKSKRDTVTVALEEFIRRRKTEGIIALFSQVDIDPNYDYKKIRSRK